MEEKEVKAWWKSRTIWVNILGAVSVLLESYTAQVLSAEDRVAILAVVNIIFRFVTDEAIGKHVSKGEK